MYVHIYICMYIYIYIYIYIYKPALVISFLLHNNLIHKVWVDLINKRQHETQGFLGKTSEPHGVNLSQRQ